MSEATIFILDPTAKARASGMRSAQRPTNMKGMTVGFLDNGWWSFGVVIDQFRRLLRERYGVGETLYLRKNTTVPAPNETIDQLAQKCRVVVNGLGN